VRDPNKIYEHFLAGQLDWYGLALPEYWYDRTRHKPKRCNADLSVA
jgi:hypothetical protein